MVTHCSRISEPSPFDFALTVLSRYQIATAPLRLRFTAPRIPTNEYDSRRVTLFYFTFDFT